MASQQLLFLETIAGLKKALKRKAYESDSDDSIDRSGNRGHKLKKRARFTHQGQLAPPSGPAVYKEEVEYAGTRRDILNRNPPLIDDDGYEVDSEDDDDRVQDAMANAAELNPYAGIRLESILAPLTSVLELATHQTLSVPFTSNTLTKLASQGGELSRKENQSLWKIKHLMTGLVGDYMWAPCGLMLGPNDAGVFANEDVLRLAQQQGQAPTSEAAGSSPATLNGDTRIENQPEGTNGESGSAEKAQAIQTNGKVSNGEDVEMADSDKTSKPEKAEAVPEKSSKTDVETSEAKDPKEIPQKGGKAEKAEHTGSELGGPTQETTKDAEKNGEKHQDAGKGLTEQPLKENLEMQDAEAQTAEPTEPKGKELQNGVNLPSASAPVASTQDGASPSNGSDIFLHPLFQVPPSARPDKDIGLPDVDADNVRHLLALYVQKQEEICRGAAKLHEGLLKADRLRKEVLNWSKAEAHSGPNRDMSDGEDWYDKVEWGLDEDLKKGQDEEEEETGTTTKKTRNRK